ncbi:exodeoxyribonuclease I [Pseudomonas sp. F1_0610]|uniref:exodeoxyribonuclease I n=1 Tax=Pseudomonas sp. F1_0610 TaxID=3114284 RepID=UPI0039C318C6
MATIFWYDFESTGINPSVDRPLQVAGIRTNEALEEVGEPFELYCQPSDDILPHPVASLVTGITPATLMQKGVSEAEFITRLNQELARPQTCSAGYNSIRFDDEMVRYTLYRNFFDPYAREWQGGNSRWDLVDVLRCAYALRPEGIIWPEENGIVSMRLELLTKANGIAHENAHDALADVRATIAMARLLKQAQPKLYNYLYNLRQKAQVQNRIKLMQPILHVSGRFGAERSYLAPVMPLAYHPTNKNAVIVCDLQADLSVLQALSADELSERLYTRHVDLKEGQLPVPLKLLHINKCPVVAPLNVLREQDKVRLAWNESLWQSNVHYLSNLAGVAEKVQAIYASNDQAVYPNKDPEQQLYAGFLSARDRGLCEKLRSLDPATIAQTKWPFSDERLPELLFRYRARNFYSTLTSAEKRQWQDYVKARLLDSDYAAPITLSAYKAALIELPVEQQKAVVLQDWESYINKLMEKYQIPNK